MSAKEGNRFMISPQVYMTST